MKLISRKAITATIAAAAISTASLTAPAMAETTTETTPPAETTTSAPAPAEEGSSSADFGSSDSDFFMKEKDGKMVEMTTAEKIKEVVTILTGIGALFGALVTINNNIDRILKNFKL